MLGKKQHSKCFLKLKKNWRILNASKKLSLFEYDFFTKNSLFIYYNTIIKKVFKDRWDCIYLPVSLHEKSSSITRRPFLEKYFIEKIINYANRNKIKIKYYKTKKIKNYSINYQKIFQILFRIKSLLYQKYYFAWSKIRFREKALIAVQLPKQLEFLKLVSRTFACFELKQKYFEKCNIDPSPNLQTQKNLYLKQKNQITKTVFKLNKHLLNRKTLITDSEALPIIRVLIEKFCFDNKKVITIPEGAQTVSEKLFPFCFFWWQRQAKCIKNFISSKYDQKIYKKYLFRSKNQITGYFGSSLKFLFINKKVAKAIFKLFAQKFKFRNPTLLVAIYGTTDPAGVWFMLPTNHEQFFAHREILNATQNIECNKVCIYTDVRCYNIYKAMYPDLIHIPPWIPWQLVERIVDVLVVRDSSLVLEFLARGCPVICFENLGLPTIVDKLKRVKSYNLFFCKKVHRISFFIRKVLKQKRDNKNMFNNFFFTPPQRSLEF